MIDRLVENNFIATSKEIYAVKYDDKTEKVYYQIMEYVPGIDLSIFLNKGMNFKMSLKTNFLFVCHIFFGLEFLHQNNLVHRNINPANILLNKDNGTVIAFFCIIKNNISRQ